VITVVTVLRESQVFSPEWVYALKRGLGRYLPEFHFRVFTDATCFGHDAIPLRHEWKDKWCLVEWFRPGLIEGQVLALGLDSLPVGDLTEIASTRVPLAGIDDFFNPTVLASGVMMWENDALGFVYEEFLKYGHQIRRTYTRMDPWLRTLIPSALRLQSLFPGQIVSFKADARRGPPENARLVIGHGNPRFNDRAAGWAHTYWKKLRT
jgi:hypothetical protein